MKSPKFPLLMSAIGAALFMAEAEAQASTGTPGAAPSTNDATVAAADKPKRAPKNPDNILNIINGRLPLALGYLVRSGKLTGTNAEIAKALATSVGKVFDLKKGRNFAYLGENYKPSADEVKAAKDWFNQKTAKGQTAQEAGAKVTEIGAMIDALGVATPEEVAARNWNVRQVGQPKAAGEAPTGGAAPAAAAAAAPAATGGETKAKMF